jgi:GH24 family phage-related lysozyme (muramidase)
MRLPRRVARGKNHVSMKTATDDAVNLMTEFEGFSACPYQDPAGVWTIGYRSTSDANGNPVCATTRASP